MEKRSRSELSVPRCIAVVALLAGCGGSQSLVGASGATTDGTPILGAARATSGYCPAYRGGTGILPDGDFAEAANPGNVFIDYGKGAWFAPEWEVAKGEIDFNGTGFWNMDGLCSVDTDGYVSGEIRSAPFRTRKGATYAVTFLLSGNGCEGSSGRHCRPKKKMVVKAAGQRQVFTWNTSGYNDVEHGVFTKEKWSFAAMSSSTILHFISRDFEQSGRGKVVAAIAVREK